MPTKRYVTRDELERAKQLHAEGLSYIEIGEQMGRPFQTIANAVRRGWVRGETPEAATSKAASPPRSTSKKRFERIISLYNDGFTLAQIRKAVKLKSSSSVGYWVGKAQKEGLIAEGRDRSYRSTAAAAVTKKGAHVNGARPVAVEVSREENSIADQKLQNHVSYCFGHTEAWLEAYCNGAGISKPNVAKQLADLLHRTARR